MLGNNMGNACQPMTMITILLATVHSIIIITLVNNIMALLMFQRINVVVTEKVCCVDNARKITRYQLIQYT